MRARMYDPMLGRFLQTDPIGYMGGMNLCAYVGNDPINFWDPLGLGGPETIGEVIIVRWIEPPPGFKAADHLLDLQRDTNFDKGGGGAVGDGGGGDGDEEEEKECDPPGTPYDTAIEAGKAGVDYTYDYVRRNVPTEMQGDEFGGRIRPLGRGWTFGPPETSGSPNFVDIGVDVGDAGTYHIGSHPGGDLGDGDPEMIGRVGRRTGIGLGNVISVLGSTPANRGGSRISVFQGERRLSRQLDRVPSCGS